LSDEFSKDKMRAAILRASVSGGLKTDKALTELALKIEAKYKENLGKGGSHQYGTPTPATPGGPPGLISGQLRRSATHSKRQTAEGLEIRIGPASTPRAPYSGTAGSTKSRRGGRTGAHAGNGATNGEVGLYLETGLRNGAKYPALLPAFHEGIAASSVTFRTVFTGGW
jgi:hypothetical protein